MAVDAALSVAGEVINPNFHTGVHAFIQHELRIEYQYTNGRITERHFFESCDEPGCEHYQGVHVSAYSGLIPSLQYSYYYGQND